MNANIKGLPTAKLGYPHNKSGLNFILSQGVTDTRTVDTRANDRNPQVAVREISKTLIAHGCQQPTFNLADNGTRARVYNDFAKNPRLTAYKNVFGGFTPNFVTVVNAIIRKEVDCETQCYKLLL